MQRTLVLQCPAGHAIKKYKCLKPWQGWTHKMRCGICTIDIERQTFRWRCGEHCEYNICEDCANEHWMGLIEQASTMDNPKRRSKLLAAVPEHLRCIPEFLDAENYVPPVTEAASSEGQNGAEKTKKVKGSKPQRPSVPFEESRCRKTLEVAFWMALWLVASVLLAFAIRVLLHDKALGFDSTLLMMATSNVVTYVLLQLTVILGKFCVSMGSDPGWRASAIFGLMRFLQVAFINSGSLRSQWYNNAALSSYPLLLLAAGLVNGSEKMQLSTLVSATLAMAGGVLAGSAKGAFTAEGSAFDGATFCVLSLLFGTVRVMMTQNWLKVEDPYHLMDKCSPALLGARMIPTISIASFEFAFITGPVSAGLELASLTRNPMEKGELFGLLATMGLCYAVATVSELQILQRSSATVLGLLVPCSCICIAVVPELPFSPLCESCQMSPLVLIGALVYALAIAIYVIARACAAPADGEIEPTDYRRLEGGEREKRHKRKSRGLPPAPPGYLDLPSNGYPSNGHARTPRLERERPRGGRETPRGAGVGELGDSGDWL